MKGRHFSCHHAWQTFVQGNNAILDGTTTFSGTSTDGENLAADLLKNLGTIARRKVLSLSMDEPQPSYVKDSMKEAGHPSVGSHPEDTHVVCSLQFSPLLPFITWMI